MGDGELFLATGDGGSARIIGGEDDWVRSRLGGGPGATVILRPSDEADADVEAHASGVLRLRAFDDDDADTEGHALALHFPSAQEADAFRRRLLAAGVLTGTLALGAAAGIGWSNMAAPDAGTGTQAVQAGAGDAEGADADQGVRLPNDYGVRPE